MSNVTIEIGQEGDDDDYVGTQLLVRQERDCDGTCFGTAILSSSLMIIAPPASQATSTEMCDHCERCQGSLLTCVFKNRKR